MKSYELSVICDKVHLKKKDDWEQARMIAYLIANANSKKRLKPTDIIQFPWEKEDGNMASTNTLTKADVERYKAIALQRQTELKKQGII